ncbi:MAG: MFS transporter, partial [Bacilli bacterium]
MFFLRWDKNLRLRFFGELATGVFAMMLMPFMAIYFSDTLGAAMTGILLALAQCFSLSIGLLGGALADKWGRKKMIMCGQYAAIFGISIMLFAQLAKLEYSSVLMFFGYSFSMIGNALYRPAAQAMIADVVEKEKQAEVFSYFYLAANVSVVLGPLLAAWIFKHNMPQILLCMFIANIVLTLIFSIFLHETYRISEKGTTTLRHELIQQFANYKMIFTNFSFFLFILGGILMHLIFGQLTTLISLHIHSLPSPIVVPNWFDNVMLPEQLFSIGFAENGFIIVVATMFIVRFLSRFSDVFVFIATSFVLS